MKWGWRSIAPRIRWTIPTTQPKQKIYVVILKTDGVDDFELPVSSITIRMRNVKASYVRVTVPNPTAYTSEILAHASGRMVICAGEKTADGARHLDELMYANIQNLYFTQGSTNTLTLTGTRYITHSSPNAVTLIGVSRISRNGGDRYKARAAFDWFVRPGDTVDAMGTVFVVDLIIHVLLNSDAHMDIEGE